MAVTIRTIDSKNFIVIPKFENLVALLFPLFVVVGDVSVDVSGGVDVGVDGDGG